MLKKIQKGKTFLNLLIMFSLLTINPSVIAGEGSGRITRIIADTGAAQVRLETHNNSPSCAIMHDGIAEWSVSTATNEGKAKYALILMAFSQNRSIAIHGTNDCSVWPDREAIRFVHITQ